MFDARLILAGQAPDPLGAARTIGELLQQRQAMQARQQTLADLLQQRAQEGALRDIYAQHADSPEGLGAALMRGGFGQQALGVEEHRAGVAAKEATAAEQQSKLRELATKILRNRVAAVKTPEHYAALATSLPPGTLSAFGLPEEYDPAAVETFVAAGIPVEKRAELDARATEAKTRREFEADQKAKDRENRTRNASIIAGDKAAAKQGDDTRDLRKEINARKEVAKYRQASAELESLRELAKGDSGASDMAIVFAFMKAMDPESVVREAEYSAAAATGTPDQRMLGLIKRWWTGGPLTSAQRQAFIKAAEGAQSGHKRAYGNAVKTYRTVAQKRGIDLAELGIEDDASGKRAGPHGASVTQGGHTYTWNPDTGAYE